MTLTPAHGFQKFVPADDYSQQWNQAGNEKCFGYER